MKEQIAAEEKPVVKIVFFGDSITESGRNLLDPEDLGVGYVKIAAGKLRLLYPDTNFKFVNRGVGGERTAELLKRVKKDVVDENPDYVVLEVGINDVWCRFSRGEEVTPEAFRANYLPSSIPYSRRARSSFSFSRMRSRWGTSSGSVPSSAASTRPFVRSLRKRISRLCPWTKFSWA